MDYAFVFVPQQVLDTAVLNWGQSLACLSLETLPD